MIKAKASKNNFQQYKKDIQQFKSSVVKIGLPKGTSGSYENGLSVIQVGAIHEYGSPSRNIPARSFLRMPMFVNRDKIKKMIFTEFIKVKNQKTSVSEALNRLGAYGEGLSKASFRDNNWSPLKPATIKAKGNKGNPLINTKQLRDSIIYKIEKS